MQNLSKNDDDFAADFKEINDKVNKENAEVEANKRFSTQPVVTSENYSISPSLEELQSKLGTQADILDDFFPDKRKIPETKVKSAFKKIKAALELTNDSPKNRQKVQSISNLAQQIIADHEKMEKQEEKQLYKQANEEAIEEGKKANSPASVQLATLAQQRPANSDESTNPYRPSWIHFNWSNSRSGKWSVDAVEVADELLYLQPIVRQESSGRTTNFEFYDSTKGQWKESAQDDITHQIDKFFADPAYYSALYKYCKKAEEDTQLQKMITEDSEAFESAVESDAAATPQYAKDLESASVLRNITAIVRAKTRRIEDATTFDNMPLYVAHCQTFDVDVKNYLKLKRFRPENYFLAALKYDPLAKALEKYGNLMKRERRPIKKKAEAESIERQKHEIISKLAPSWQQWLYLSLGCHKELVHAFLERLGLAMLHNYEDNFYVLVPGKGGHGKSKFFTQIRSLFETGMRSNLDLSVITRDQDFDISTLHYKTINITSENHTQNFNEEAVNKLNSITGGDEGSFSVKFKEAADFTPTAHMFLNMNNMPHFGKNDSSVARRMDIFDWHEIKNFDEKIGWKAIDQEKPEIITLALIYACECLNRKKKHFDYCDADLRLFRPQIMIDRYNAWVGDNDMVAQFIDEKCVRGTEYRIGKGKLQQEINHYMRDIGERTQYHNNQLQSALSSLGIETSHKKTTFYGYDDDDYMHSKLKLFKGYIVYEGITLKKIAAELQTKKKVKTETDNFNEEQKQAGQKRWQEMENRANVRNINLFDDKKKD